VDHSETMQAAVFLGPERMELRDVPVRRPAPGQVLLRVEACGVCGTDHHIFAGELTAGVRAPVILGHEIAARVEALGEGVGAFERGRLAAVDPVIGCRTCPECRAGRSNLCANPTVVGYALDGGYARYVVVPAEKVVPLAESAGAAGGVLCETLACVINGYDRLGFTAGASALILGAGTVGLLWLQLLARSPASVVLQSEPVAYRRNKAADLGADVVIDPGAGDLAEAVRAELPRGVDVIVDASGDPHAVEQAVGLLAPGGTLMVFGVCPEGSAVRVDPFALYDRQAKIVASKMPPGTLDRAAALIEAGRIPCDAIVTSTVSLGEAAAAVAAFNDHRDSQVKVAVDPWMAAD